MKKIVNVLLLLVLGLTLAPLPTLAQGEVACENEVVVQAADFLSTIADKYYGNILAYPAIVEATNAQGDDFATIENPDVIEPGWKLCIASVEDAQAILGQELSTTAAASTTEGEKIELRMAWWGSQDRHDRTIKVIEMYEAANPNIDITYEFAGFDDYWTLLAPQAAGGNLPDIMQQDYARIEEWVANDLMLPLDGFVESGLIDLSDVPVGSIDGGRVGGTLYAINLGNNSQTMVLDVDAFAQAGIELPPQDWTWADFERIVLELHDKLGIWGVGAQMADQQMWKSVYLGHGEWGYSTDGKSLGYTNDQIFADYLHMLLRLQEAGAMPSREEELARFFQQSVEVQPLVTKEAAMQFIWSNQVVAVQTAAGEERNFVLTHLPRPEGGVPTNYLKPSQFFSITKHAKYPEEAAKFISYFTNDVEANKILLGERGVPIAAHINEALGPLLGKPQVATVEYLKRVEADSSPIRPADPPGHADFEDRFGVKLTLLEQLGVLFGAGDRHVAEFFAGFLTEASEYGQHYGVVLTKISHREQLAAWRRTQIEHLAKNGASEKLQASDEQLAPVMVALTGGPTRQFVVNLPNTGQIDNLPRDAVVECIAEIDVMGVRPLATGLLPPAAYAAIAPHVARQELIVEAGLTGQNEPALAALTTDPLIRDAATVRPMFDDLMAANAQFITPNQL